MAFLNLDYKTEDTKLGIQVLGLSVVSDWDRKAGETFRIDMDGAVFEKAAHYVERIVTGKFNYA